MAVKYVGRVCFILQAVCYYHIGIIKFRTKEEVRFEKKNFIVNEKLVHMNLTNYGEDVKLIDIEYENIYRMLYKRLKINTI